ncbi:MAG: peptide ABC transporter substrate-binding protein [Patescibacteria group bacterium]
MFFKIFQIIKTFSRPEQLVFFAALLSAFISAVFLTVDSTGKKTAVIPIAGGDYREGTIGQPVFVNPVLAGANDIDRDLVKIIFSDMLDLTENYKIGANGKVFNVRLKDSVFWQDGKAIVSDDVVFTVKAIQNPDSRSPLYSAWQGIEVQRVSEREIKFILPFPYSFFENTLRDLRPVPKHVFENIPVANYRLSGYNLEPIGSGPFKFVSFDKRRDGFITDYYLERSENYFGQNPYLNRLNFRFYGDKKDLIGAFNKGEIDGVGGLNYDDLAGIRTSHKVFNLRSSKYYALFFNANTPALKEKNVRSALNLAVDKSKIIKDVFGGLATEVGGPLMPQIEGYAPDVYRDHEFSTVKAAQILEESGWVVGDDGIRGKEKSSKEDPIRLEFNLVVPDISFLTKTAEIIREDWLKIGVKLNLAVKSSVEINEEIIRTRGYEMIIFGNVFGVNSDIFSFWHSSERFYPGLNLAMYHDKIVDELIEAAREEIDEERKQRYLSNLQAAIIGDASAIFLFSPNYFYVSKNLLKGFEEKYVPLPSDRFENIEKWYVKTTRVFK